MLPLEFSSQQLCMDLLHADTEERVIDLLSREGYWDDSDAWRPFGNRKDNFSTIGNQSSSADGALVEKLINSVDAVLMGECWVAGVRPNSPEAPRSIPEAVAQFFFDDRSKANTVQGQYRGTRCQLGPTKTTRSLGPHHTCCYRHSPEP